MSDPTSDFDAELETSERAYCAKDLKRYFALIGAVALVVLFGAFVWRNSHDGGLKLSTLMAQFETDTVANAPAAHVGPASGAAPVAQTMPVAIPMVGGRFGDQVAPAPAPMGPSAPGQFANVVAVLRNSVVSVTASSAGGGAMPDPAAMLGGIVDGQTHFTSPVTRAVENIGSGVVVRSDGYILTNYHVVRGANTVYVTIQDDVGSGRYAADIVKMDDALDLALLKVTPKSPLSPAVLGNSDAVNVADEVIAIGSPFGLDMTVSRGIISAKRKSMVIEGVTHTNLLQTDAAINQGNSGGPLVANNGAVIGINTAIYTPNGAFAGIGFAVSSNIARRFVLDEIATLPISTTEGPKLGLVALPQPGVMTGGGVKALGAAGPAIAANAVAPHTDGRENMDCALCHEVLPVGAAPRGMTVAQPGVPAISANAPSPHRDGRGNCAACHQILPANGGMGMTGAAAGMTVAAPGLPPPPIPRGTQSPHTDGRQNMDCAMCHQILPAGGGAAAGAGMTVAATPMQFAVPPGSLAMNVVAPPTSAVGSTGRVVLGATLTPMSATLAGQSGIAVGRGVFVGAVAPGSPSALAELRPGDVLVKVDGRPVAAPQDVMALLGAAAPGQAVRLGVLHEGEMVNRLITVGPTGLAAAMPGNMAAQHHPGMAMGQGQGQGMGGAGLYQAPMAAAAIPAPPAEFNWLGMEIETFQATQPQVAGMQPGMAVDKGAVVGEVLAGSRAALAGVRINDIVTAVDGYPVTNAGQLDAAIKAAAASPMPIQVRVNRMGQEFLLTL